jgi:hypothetical protein
MFLKIFTCSFEFWFTVNFANREGFTLYVHDFLFSHDVKASSKERAGAANLTPAFPVISVVLFGRI